ncbi:MAG: ribosome recycling factor [Flavobacteriaceae bacterium]|nr:MAG: ribosome recycling factor [Flavobacteriaceae bacterium]
MNEDLKFIIDSAKESMDDSIVHLEKEFRRIRAGKATPAMLASVMVDYYGTQTPLSQIANVSTMDAHTITVQPYEKSMLQEVERGVMFANLGFNPMNNGDIIIIAVPPLTEDRRKDLAKQAKAASEKSKVSLRNDRKEAMQEIKGTDVSEDEKSNAEADIEKLVKSYSLSIEKLASEKEVEIMKV